jgi:hypothetical protein
MSKFLKSIAVSLVFSMAIATPVVTFSSIVQAQTTGTTPTPWSWTYPYLQAIA